MNILGIIFDLLFNGRGWRTFVPVFIAGCIAIGIYFTVGFKEPWESLMLVGVLVSVLVGIAWQHNHEKQDS
jgi:uncharacterized membrane protein YjjP (DUF1212 family)